MKWKYLLFLLIFPLISVSQPKEYSSWFHQKSFRFDFLLGGNSREVTVYPQQIKEEPYWAGSFTNLIDTFHFGSYRFHVYDVKSDKLLFSKGLSLLFQEWQTTAEAKKENRVFYQAAIFPFPKKNVRLQIDARQWDGNFKTIYTTEIDPDDYFIKKEKPFPFEVVSIVENGKTEEKVDLVILAEGYTSGELEKFIADARRLISYLFEVEPFKSEKDKFNVRAVLTPSTESGTDMPGDNVYKNTFFNTSFYTFNEPRYLTTADMKSVYDAAAVVPYDQIYLLVNSDRYGGGGFYNFISVCTSDNQYSPEVFVHEFGHAFAGLGDEYYGSTVTYQNFYNLKAEPWEANLTTLVDFEKKWIDMLSDSIPVPTPRNPKFLGRVGVYEGGGYVAKGIYSPYLYCRMKSNQAKYFCPVCTDVIKRMIDFYCK